MWKCARASGFQAGVIPQPKKQTHSCQPEWEEQHMGDAGSRNNILKIDYLVMGLLCLEKWAWSVDDPWLYSQG